MVFDLDTPAPGENVAAVTGDVRDVAALTQAARDCDAGVHLAVVAGEASEADLVSVNVAGALAFFNAARVCAFRTSVLASSAPVHLPPTTTDLGMPLATSKGADHVYDLTKALQELIAGDFHGHGLPAICLRFGHIVHGAAERSLHDDLPLELLDYCRGGWVALEDVATACAAALAIEPRQEFEILNVVGARSSRARFGIDATERRLDMRFEYDFAVYA